MELDLQAVNLEEEGRMWSETDYAPVPPMDCDHDPLGLASMAENTDVEPVNAHEWEGGPALASAGPRQWL